MPEIYRSQRAGTIADLMRQRGQVSAEAVRGTGDAEAQRAMASGQAWGGAIQNIGQTVSGTLRDYAQHKADAPNRELRQRQSDLIAKQLSELETTQAQAEIGRLAQMVQASGYDPGTAEPIFRAIGQLSPYYAEPLLRSLMDPKMLKNVTDTLVSQVPGYKAPEGFSLSPGQRRYDAQGNEIATAPEPTKPPEPFTLSPGASRFNPDGTPIASVPATPPAAPREPQPTEASLAMAAASGDPNALKALNLLRAQRPTGGDNEPLQTIIGPDGKPVLVRRSDAVGKTPASGTSKPATGLEKRALNFFNRAQQADTDLEDLETQVQSLGLGGQTYMEWAPNFMQTELGQQYTQAQRAFTEARLRKDSGAAIPETEFVNDRRTYFAQPGDSKDTLEQKRRARAAVLASLGFESGQALGEFVGDTDEARRIVDGYKARAAKPQGGGSGKVRMQAPDGSVQDVDPSMVEHYKAKGAKVVP